MLLPLDGGVSAWLVVAEDLDLLHRVVARLVDVRVLAAALVAARPHAMGGRVLGRAAVCEVGGDERVYTWNAGADYDNVELVAERGVVSSVTVREFGYEREEVGCGREYAVRGRTYAVQMNRGSVFPVLYQRLNPYIQWIC